MANAERGADELDAARALRKDADPLGEEIVIPFSREAVDGAPRTKGRASSDRAAGEFWPPPLDLAALAKRKPVPPRFKLRGMLPCGYATLLAGHGGVGKSAIALYLAVCIAAGLDFFGIPVERSRVMYLSCEDREGLLHWRLSFICAALGVDLEQLHREGWLVVLDLVGRETILWERDPKTGHSVTSAHACLAERIARHRTQVLFVDGVSDTYGGSEGSKTEVKRYVNALVALVPADDGAVVLIGHVNRPTASAPETSEGYSGTTGWHNAVRARLYLYPETRDGDDSRRRERTGDLLLEVQKSNLGPIEAAMRFAWDDAAGLFLGRLVAPATPSDRAHRDQVDSKAILAAIVTTVAANDYVPAAMSGNRTALHVLSARPGFPAPLAATGSGRRRFGRLIEELRSMGLVREGSIRRKNRHSTAILEPTPEGLRQCAEWHK